MGALELRRGDGPRRDQLLASVVVELRLALARDRLRNLRLRGCDLFPVVGFANDGQDGTGRDDVTLLDLSRLAVRALHLEQLADVAAHFERDVHARRRLDRPGGG
jgi:hypothetical protein